MGKPRIDLCERIEVERGLRPPYGLLALKERGQDGDEACAALRDRVDAASKRLCTGDRDAPQLVPHMAPLAGEQVRHVREVGTGSGHPIAGEGSLGAVDGLQVLG